MTEKRALIAGASGIVGSNLAEHLSAKGWKVFGLSRSASDSPTMTGIAADLLDAAALKTALAGVRPTHVFITTWMRQATEAENIRVNSLMVRNLLDSVAPSRSVQHVALVTGLKHYLGPFESYGKGKMPATPFREDAPRLDIPNFYYAQEDEVFAAAAREGYSWSVHRPHTIIGYAIGNAMNMGVTLATYASLCKETGRPFVFPGSQAQWSGVTDMTDARLLARHLEWAATSPAAANRALNVVNGDVFRWSWMWSEIARWFEIEPAPFPSSPAPLEKQLEAAGPLWTSLAEKHGLAEKDLSRLSSAWHTDADLGRPIEVIADMTLSRKLGFKDYQPTNESFFELFAKLRENRLIP
jgi:nucleoside-diphosphate-sugar epimerase